MHDAKSKLVSLHDRVLFQRQGRWEVGVVTQLLPDTATCNAYVTSISAFHGVVTTAVTLAECTIVAHSDGTLPTS